MHRTSFLSALLVLFLVALVSLTEIDPIVSQSDLVTLVPTSFVNTSGDSGFEQIVANLHVQDQTGSQ